jgi:hypothetical protein
MTRVFTLLTQHINRHHQQARKSKRQRNIVNHVLTYKLNNVPHISSTDDTAGSVQDRGQHLKDLRMGGQGLQRAYAQRFFRPPASVTARDIRPLVSFGEQILQRHEQTLKKWLALNNLAFSRTSQLFFRLNQPRGGCGENNRVIVPKDN